MQGMKEVYFGTYCSKCKWSESDPADDPCDVCLSEDVRLYSHIPVKYEWDPKRGEDPRPKKK